MSDLLIFTQDHAATAIAFLQVFAGVGFVVLIGYGIKSYFFPSEPIQRMPLPPARPRRKIESRLLRRQPIPRIAPQQQKPDAQQPVIRLPMPAELHWQRAVAPVHATIAHGRRARELHQHALTRLDAADYAFGRLLDELKSVVSLPAHTGVARNKTPVFSTGFSRASLAA